MDIIIIIIIVIIYHFYFYHKYIIINRLLVTYLTIDLQYELGMHIKFSILCLPYAAVKPYCLTHLFLLYLILPQNIFLDTYKTFIVSQYKNNNFYYGHTHIFITGSSGRKEFYVSNEGEQNEIQNVFF